MTGVQTCALPISMIFRRSLLYIFLLSITVASPDALALMKKKGNASKDAKESASTPSQSPETGWTALCADALPLLADVRRVVHADRKPLRRNFQEDKLKFQNAVSGQPGIAGELSAIFFNRVLNDKDIPAIIQTVEHTRSRALHYGEQLGPLVNRAESLNAAAAAVRECLRDALAKKKPSAPFVSDPGDPPATDGMDAEADAARLEKHQAAQQAYATWKQTPAGRLLSTARPATGPAADELSLSLFELDKALADGDTERAAVWAAETYGASKRLLEALRWTALICEWLSDYSDVLLSERSDYEWIHAQASFQSAGGWKNFMFGRLPGAQSIMYNLYDIAAADQLLSDLLILDDAKIRTMGTLAPNAIGVEIAPGFRSAFFNVRDGLPPAIRSLFETIPDQDWELGIFHANIWIWADEDRLDDLIATLARYQRNYKKPTFQGMMEIMHVRQGAWGSSNTIKDRYHPKIMEWATELQASKTSPMKPEGAAQLAWRRSNEFYGGKYAGAKWTLTEAIDARQLDCIRISQMIGCIYANAGFPGLRPVRIHRNSKNRMPLTGHTFVDVLFGEKDDLKDGLDKASLGTFDAYIKGKTDLWSVERGYRSLAGYTSGEIYLPNAKTMVTVRMPYYGLVRSPVPAK